MKSLKVYYKLTEKDALPVSTPEAEEMDPELIAELYYHAGKLETIYPLLVVKEGKPVEEKYFNQGYPDQKSHIQSVTKSFISALTGITLDLSYINDRQTYNYARKKKSSHTSLFQINVFVNS